jgi:hypothetical protein
MMPSGMKFIARIAALQFVLTLIGTTRPRLVRVAKPQEMPTGTKNHAVIVVLR